MNYPPADRPFPLIDVWTIDESPAIERYTATGRAKCRLCGEKIAKGEQCIRFFFSLTDGTYNAWTAIEGKAHTGCYEEQAKRPVRYQ